MNATYHIGDVFDVMRQWPDASVDLVLTSPPFLALRSYLPADHPDKAKEIGSEPTPAEFLDTLLALTAEWGRLLTPYGSIAVELGDTYAGSGGGGGDYLPGGWKDHQPGFGGSADAAREGNAAHWRQKNAQRDAWPLDKSLCVIPHLYAACLAYGRNVLTGEPSPAGQWRVRNVVAWCRSNPPVGALGDKYRPATSYMTIATKARDRWFDLDAVREATGYDRSTDKNIGKVHVRDAARAEVGLSSGKPWKGENPAGAPPLDWWNIPTEPYPGSHYATWPRKLIVKPIESMCPRQVCVTCGEPRRRIVEATYTPRGDPAKSNSQPRVVANPSGVNPSAQAMRYGEAENHVTTIGWTDCGHDTWRAGIVLDPFGGSGTTGAVATGLGRDAWLIDIDERNAELARDRIGPMFIEVIDTRKGAA